MGVASQSAGAMIADFTYEHKGTISVTYITATCTASIIANYNSSLEVCQVFSSGSRF